MVDFLIVLVAVVVLTAIGIGIMVRRYRSRLGADRRDRARIQWRSEQRARRDRRRLESLRKYYPYLTLPAGGSTTPEALAQAIQGEPGTVIGSGPAGMPVVLPRSLRTRHVLVIGRSGVGKTTLGDFVVADDFRRGNVVALGGENEGFREHLLPLVPMERAAETVYFAPGQSGCDVGINFFELEDGDDRDRYASEMYHAFKGATGESSIGSRSDAIARNLFAALVGVEGATFLTIRPFLEDEAVRREILKEVPDSIVRQFWETSYPSFPRAAAQPILNRIDEFTGPAVRKALCCEKSTFSLRHTLNTGNFLGDLSGLPPDAFELVVSLLLTRVQIEIMRRDVIEAKNRPFTALIVDEWHMVACCTPEHVWENLAARSRRMNFGMFLLSQSTHTIPRRIRNAVLSNSSTCIAFSLSAQEAASLRREFPIAGSDGSLATVKAEHLVSLPIGEGYARIGSAAYAMRVKFKPPDDGVSIEHGMRVRGVSWKKYGAVTQRAPSKLAVLGAARGRSSEDGYSSGRGGLQHSTLQQLAKQWGEEHGFRAEVEASLLAGSRRVDVLLSRGSLRVAVEVCLTNSPTEASTLVSCAVNEFTHGPSSLAQLPRELPALTCST